MAAPGNGAQDDVCSACGMKIAVIVCFDSLLTWRSPDASKQLLSALVVAFVLSSVMSGVALFRLTGTI